MDQFSNLVEFRQAVYERGLGKARDAQFELVDALPPGQPLRSFPGPGLLVPQIPANGPQLFSLDGTAWPLPAVRTLADLQYVFSPTRAVDSGSVVVGYPHSVPGWVPEADISRALPAQRG